MEKAERSEDKVAERKDLSSAPLMKTPKSQLTAEQPLKRTGTCQKRYSTPKDKETQEGGRRVHLPYNQIPYPPGG